MQPAPVTDAERAEAIQRLQGGQSIHAVARELGRSKSTIAAIARQAGIDTATEATQRAAEARERVSRARRMELLARAIERCDDWLRLATPRESQAVLTAIGICIDKIRLEEGEATSRHETIARDKLVSRVTEELARVEDELAKRRRAKP